MGLDIFLDSVVLSRIQALRERDKICIQKVPESFLPAGYLYDTGAVLVPARFPFHRLNQMPWLLPMELNLVVTAVAES